MNLYFASEFICGCRPYIPSHKLDYEPSEAPIIPWQHSVEDYRVSSVRSYKKQPSSCLEETNPTYPDAHDRGAVKESFLDEPIREHVLGIEDHYVSDLSTEIDVQDNSFDQMNQEADCINLSVQEVKQDQAEVIEHSSIYESNLPTIEQENLQYSNKELSKDVCIVQRVASHDVGFLIPET